MKLLGIFLCLLNSVRCAQLLTGFGTRADQLNEWEINNDGVMGGLSEGHYTIEDNMMTFDGTISLENNGGFSVVSGRKNYGETLDLSAFEVT